MAGGRGCDSDASTMTRTPSVERFKNLKMGAVRRPAASLSRNLSTASVSAAEESETATSETLDPSEGMRWMAPAMQDNTPPTSQRGPTPPRTGVTPRRARPTPTPVRAGGRAASPNPESPVLAAARWTARPFTRALEPKSRRASMCETGPRRAARGPEHQSPPRVASAFSARTWAEERSSKTPLESPQSSVGKTPPESPQLSLNGSLNGLGPDRSSFEALEREARRLSERLAAAERERNWALRALRESEFESQGSAGSHREAAGPAQRSAHNAVLVQLLQQRGRSLEQKCEDQANAAKVRERNAQRATSTLEEHTVRLGTAIVEQQRAFTERLEAMQLEQESLVQAHQEELRKQSQIWAQRHEEFRIEATAEVSAAQEDCRRREEAWLQEWASLQKGPALVGSAEQRSAPEVAGQGLLLASRVSTNVVPAQGVLPRSPSPPPSPPEIQSLQLAGPALPSDAQFVPIPAARHESQQCSKERLASTEREHVRLSDSLEGSLKNISLAKAFVSSANMAPTQTAHCCDERAISEPHWRPHGTIPGLLAAGLSRTASAPTIPRRVSGQESEPIKKFGAAPGTLDGQVVLRSLEAPGLKALEAQCAPLTQSSQTVPAQLETPASPQFGQVGGVERRPLHTASLSSSRWPATLPGLPGVPSVLGLPTAEGRRSPACSPVTSVAQVPSAVAIVPPSPSTTADVSTCVGTGVSLASTEETDSSAPKKLDELQELMASLSGAADGPEAAKVWARIGQLHQRRKAFSEAHTAYSAAVRLDGSQHGSVANLAQLEAHMGHLPAARELLGRALELDPTNAAYRSFARWLQGASASGSARSE